MIHKVARFKVKPEAVQDCRVAIHGLLQSIKNEKGTLRYEAYELPDKVSFIHLMSFSDAEAEKKHQESEHVKKFAEILYPNCEQEPEFISVESSV